VGWIVTLPRRGYRFVGPAVMKSEADVPAAPMDPAATPSPVMAPALPDKPSIAVLPFENLSSDPEQGYFADGMVEEIITALSRNRLLFVIALARDGARRLIANGSACWTRSAGAPYCLSQQIETSGLEQNQTGAATGDCGYPRTLPSSTHDRKSTPSRLGSTSHRSSAPHFANGPMDWPCPIGPTVV
jgi:hypothetical protein